METTRERAKSTAIEHYRRRRIAANNSDKIKNEDLPAGAPCIFYCHHCGILLEKLPEDYLFAPLTECSQCLGLIKHNWLEEAKQAYERRKAASVLDGFMDERSMEDRIRDV